MTLPDTANVPADIPAVIFEPRVRSLPVVSWQLRGTRVGVSDGGQLLVLPHDVRTLVEVQAEGTLVDVKDADGLLCLAVWLHERGHACWWMLPLERGGGVCTATSAVLLTWSVRRVQVGLLPVTGLYGPWWDRWDHFGGEDSGPEAQRVRLAGAGGDVLCAWHGRPRDAVDAKALLDGAALLDEAGDVWVSGLL